MFPVGLHLDELFAGGIDHIAGLFGQSSPSDDIAWIMQGDGLFEFFSDRDLPVFDQLMVKINGMHDGYGRHAPAQPAVAHVVNGAKGMTAFTHHDALNP